MAQVGRGEATVDESGIEYALDKYKLLRVAPIPLNNEKMVAFLIDGLASWQHVAAMTANRPANVTDFHPADSGT